jgi:putative ABC transport system permease protein
MNFLESIFQAFESVRANKLRAGLTLLSISIGVFAIIFAGGIVNSIDNTVTGEMSAMGENSFMIRRRPSIQMGGPTWFKYAKRKVISSKQLKDLKKVVTSTPYISGEISDQGYVLKSKYMESDPNVTVTGGDEMYFNLNNLDIKDGRAITELDVNSTRNYAVIGNDIIVKIFPGVNPIGKKITLQGQQYEVIGTLKERGAIMGNSQDNLMVIPLTSYMKYHSSQWESIDIKVKAIDRLSLPNTIDEVVGALRTIRNQKPWQENSFELETNESIAEQFSVFTNFLSYFGIFAGGFALLAAGIGIMNIMLVTVKERTREIGIRKAVGAKKSWILIQFIIETITLCQIGGFIGISLGVVASLLASSLLGLAVELPINWILISIAICTVLGVVFGSFPAWKAANLDPIESLRYE